MLLIRRGHPPYKGSYALPGGFVEIGETVEDACPARASGGDRASKAGRLRLRRGLLRPQARSARTYLLGGVPCARWRGPSPKAGDDAAAAEWVDGLVAGIELAFDHVRVLADASRVAAGRRACGATLLSKESEMGDFDGKVILVTGGATGLGAAIALGAAKRGAKAVILNCSKSLKEAEATAAAVRAAGAEAVIVQGDVAEDADCRRIAAAAARFGRLDAWSTTPASPSTCQPRQARRAQPRTTSCASTPSTRSARSR